MSNIINVYHRGGAALSSSIPTGNIKTLLERLNENLSSQNQVDKNFIFEFNVLRESNLKEGNLVYVFKPFRNMRLASDVLDDEGNVITLAGEIIDFSTKDLNFSINKF